MNFLFSRYEFLFIGMIIYFYLYEIYIMSGTIANHNPSTLGGGLPGGQPPGGLLGGGGGSTGGTGMVGSSERGRDRKVLRKALGRFPVDHANLYNAKKHPITPFRQAYNAGDSNGTVNSTVLPGLPTHTQVGGTGKGQLIYGRAGGVHHGGNSAFTGNPKHVYDSSDYIRFKKLQSKNRTYNDYSFGGANNGAYVPLMRARRGF
jgi:hypothetical protein